MCYSVGRLLGDELDEVAARVVEDGDDGGTDVVRRLGERDPRLGQSGVLGLDVVHRELSQRDPVFGESVPVGLDRRVTGWLQHQLWPLRTVRRDDGQPEIVSERDLVVFDEAEYLGIELQRGSLVVYVETGEMDPRGVSFLAVGQRLEITASGSRLK